MGGFAAIILVCLNAVPADQCTEDNAVDVLSTHVENELGCWNGWQEMMGRMAAAHEIGTQAYVRTLCRREPR